MTREWQQTRFRDLVMPDAVYYQSIWAVRDLIRMEERLKTIDHNLSGLSARPQGLVRDPVAGRRDAGVVNAERKILETRVDAIRKALEGVPPSYRDFIIDNIIKKKSGADYPNKIWRVWKQRFLYDVAKNLSLM